MKVILKTALILLLLLSVVITVANAQNQFDALRFSQTMPSHDPSVMAVGGSTVTSLNGYSSFLQNPATVALSKESLFSLGLNTREVRENTTYRNSQATFDDSQGSFSHIGYLYRFPTTQGSLVVGGGYSQTLDFNRASSVDVFNPEHSIVDFFLASPGDQYFLPAYDTYAIDDDPAIMQGYYNVLRADGSFLGMNQYMELKERGNIGEYSLFMGTEFQKNWYVGASVGISAGNYRYKRVFVEEDLLNSYEDASYDVDAILNEDIIRASLRGVNARIGVLYKSDIGVNFGASYTTATTYTIDETYSTFIQTDYKTLDADGFNRYESTYEGEFSYNVRKPSIITVGAGITTLPFADFEISAELVNYTGIEFSGISVTQDRDLNNAIRNDFKDVVNLRFGATVPLGDNMILRGGYAYQPSPRLAYDAAITTYAGGLSIEIGNGISLDMGASYSTFNDQIDLYQFNGIRASSTQSVNKVQGSLGITFSF